MLRAKSPGKCAVSDQAQEGHRAKRLWPDLNAYFFLLTSFPVSSKTLMLLRASWMGSLNQIRTSVGGFLTLLPTRGCARTKNACALARVATANKPNNTTATEMSCFRILLFRIE